MGASLPAIARWMESTREGVSRLGLFYGANIAGAVFGCLLTGFYLLRVHDTMTATLVAAAINAVVAIVSLLLAARGRYGAARTDPVRSQPIQPAGCPSAYVVIGFSGLCALGAEVIWTRQLSLLLGASVYTFSIILAVFLTGLGIGSSVGAFISRGPVDPRLALGWCQLLLTAALLWTAIMLAQSLPYWPIDPSLSSSPWLNFQLDLMRCIWAVLPAAILWGASFPLALAAAASRGQDPGRLVGGVYAANTVGAIVGAIGFSMIFISWLGTQRAHQLLIGLSAVSAMLMFAPIFRQAWRSRASRTSDNGPARLAVRLGVAGPLVALPCLSALLILWVPDAPQGLIAYGRYLASRIDMPTFIYVGEGMNASIAISELPDGTRNFHVSGKVVASSEPQDMRLQRMLGHLPALVHPQPRSVLVVGCGAGVTAGTFVLYPDVERIVICEIEPLIPPAANAFFGEENDYVLEDPRVEVVYDDARHYLVTTSERFDIITSDPIHPWVKGAAALYSREYFELCKQRLTPGGVTTQWVPLYETNLAAVKSEIATFFEVYPNGTIWGNDMDGEGYDIVLLGQAEAKRIDVDGLQQRLERPDHQLVLQSLDDVSLGAALSLMTTYAGRASDLLPWLEDAAINEDRSLRLQYLAGMSLNVYDAEGIYDSMLAYRTYPDDLFGASGIRGRALRAVLQQPASE
jgi:spermidine synthase